MNIHAKSIFCENASIISEELGELMSKDPSVTPGLNGYCMVCGKHSKKPMNCRKCGQVDYCSADCLDRDRSAETEVDDDFDEAVAGHSASICDTLCRLAEWDSQSSMSPEETELHSYPATLSNLLLKQPLFEGVLSSNSHTTIYIIGASENSEIFADWTSAYADALDDVTETFNTSLTLNFIGPDLKASSSAISLTPKIKATLSSALIQDVAPSNPPQIAVFFNPGFTCPDYDWSAALSSLFLSTSSPLHFMATTNTEVEGLEDVDWLVSHKYMKSPNSDTDGTSFFTHNPWCGDLVRQSGVLGNDLYKKNSIIYGGLLLPTASSKSKRSSLSCTDSPSKKKSKGNSALI